MCSLILMTLIFSRHILEKHTTIKFRQNSSSVSRAISGGRTGGQTDITKPIVGDPSPQFCAVA